MELPANVVQAGMCPECLARLGSEEALAVAEAASTLTLASPLVHADQHCGPYRIVRLLGAGGMGSVYLAQQEDPIRRRVALKLIKLGMDTDEVIARFESERQALALMDHPNIARVFDAGVSDHGRPYFVMEYVQGVSITRYCDEHRLTTRQRLELFRPVCMAIHHAHQKGIIHRDVKPSNILIGNVDGQPAPKIIDFGVAKATNQRLTEKTVFTQLGILIGTPAYMSPEQAEVTSLDIDATSDIFSLGVVLYELLVGALPFDAATLRKLGYDEIRRILREQEPPTPTARLHSLGAGAAEVARRRRTDVGSLERQLRGDLDRIPMKAMEKERSRRYASASEFAADIARYLNDEPVLAGPPSRRYRVRKFIRRHRTGVVLTTGLVLLLALFAGNEAVQLRRITRERDRADRVTSFFTRMFKVADPSEARGNHVTAREILDKASNDIGAGLASDPELQAQLMHVMGSVYYNLGLYGRAHSLFTQAIQIRRRILGPQHLETLSSTQELANVLAGEGHTTEAEQLCREVLGIRRRVLGAEAPDTLRSLNTLGRIVDDEGNYAEAERVFRQLRDINLRRLGPEHPDTLRSMNNLGIVLDQEGRDAEAEEIHRRVIEGDRRTLGPDHPETVHAMDALANTLDNERQYAQSEKLEREVIGIRQRVLGPEHQDTLLSTANLALTLMHMGRNAEAEKLLRQVLDLQGRVLGPEHQDTLHVMSRLANAIAYQGRFAEAEKMQLEALAIRRRVLGPEHPDTASSTYNLARLAALRNQPESAMALIREALDHGLDEPTALGMEQDSNLKSLRGDPRFQALLAYARKHVTAAPKAK
jgi:serine/threonine protein kinase